MKKVLISITAATALLLCGGSLFAGSDAKQVTITGNGMCAKCELGETDQCQTAIEVTENDKKTVYYLASTDAAKAYHRTICQATVKTKATGTVEIKDGKHVMTASTVEKAE